ncbi:MAG TPA: SDR family NAD(P)-dependent oxidoreductase [Thermoanaerobaculia bacterium]|nr:SDR family NAD(P)-dependent oxidoreductase [Thermoanaerobaculia bacterium]
MVDFVEYVVGELKSKRLSKDDAASLVRQFARRTQGGPKAEALHPLLHANTSDLSEQRFRSTFAGDEFFLVDHQVQAADGVSHKVLPGMAYLEMARAAIEHALPERPEGAVIELRDVVWAQPIVVGQPREIGVALIPAEGEDVDFEIYSEDSGQEVVHCQGRARVVTVPAPEKVHVDMLLARADRGQMDPAGLYAAFSRLGLFYGPTFQGLTEIRRGHDEVVAKIRLPQPAEETSDGFVLHPSLMDSALQASAALMSELVDEARLPFMMESLRVFAPWTRDLVAWVRYSPGSKAGDTVIELDYDLCDEQGNVCVQLRGVYARATSTSQVLASVSEPAQRRAIEEAPEAPAPAPAATELDSATLAEKTQDFLRRQFSVVLKVPAGEIAPQAPLENYGIDSILAMKLTEELEKTFGTLSKTLFFEYQTVRDLAEHFLTDHAEKLQELFAQAPARPAPEAKPVTPEVLPPAAPKRSARRRGGRARGAAPAPKTQGEPIAIVGLSGRYPEAVDLEAYWRNLRDGKDCIVEVPKERWDWREYYSEDRTKGGRHYSKWGGFITGVEEFDPLFFNISPLEAEIMDPQERLFLQHVWMALEDAGYTRAALQVPHEQDLAGQVGVYVGVMYSEYQLVGAEASVRGNRVGIPGSIATIANRVSYVLDLHGPSMTLDTMCSSSLSAIHLACQDLRQGRTSMAIAGGVNVTIHPNKYLALSGGQFISSDGHCQSFGEGGDGYIPGEGVGVVVLKRLSEAERDGDRIYGIIRGSALNHGGKTNGYTVPNPQAQAGVIGRALRESGTDARHISYLEAHGTGTKLGDPIEIAALSKAFGRFTDDTGFCRIGSAKSNIGHCESAAGIAGLTKVLLQMQHRQIVPSLHSAKLNPHIDFDSTPFVVNQTLRPWEPPVVDGRTLPRIAGISSFGAGGSNAHMVIEEYPAPAPRAFEGPFAIVLSARTPEQLRQKAADLLAFVRERAATLDLPSVAWTLQAGREPMEERLAFVVASTEQLLQKLQAYVNGNLDDAYFGQVKRGKDALSLFAGDADLQQTVEKWIAAKKLPKLLDLWVKGLELDWSRLWGETRPLRTSLPTYPFAKERYWIDVPRTQPALGAAAAVLHPLLHANTSDLSEQRYRSTFTGDEFFLTDHRVNGGKVLPGVAYLEMTRAAIEQAVPERPEGTVLELRDLVWAQPAAVDSAKELHLALWPAGESQLDYEIYSQDGDEDAVHCQGRALWSRQSAPAALDLPRLARRLDRGTLEPRDLYAACERMGLGYGPSFQGVTAVRRGNGEVLAWLQLPKGIESTSADYVLHPALMDSALQAAAGLLDDLSAPEPRLPFALDALRIHGPCSESMVAWVRYAPGSRAGDAVVKLDVDLCDADGNVRVELRGFATRARIAEVRQQPAAAPPPRKHADTLLATPVWLPTAETYAANEYAEHHVIVCEMALIDGDAMRAHLPQSRFLALQADPEKNIAERYTEYALACFERIQSILQSKPQGNVLVQVVVPHLEEQAVLEGLAAMLKTAALENPKVAGQLLLVSPSLTADVVARHLEAEKAAVLDPVVRYDEEVRALRQWQPLPPNAEEPPLAFRDGGVYLITGGVGGLGLIFANEILTRTRDARIVLTGRAPLTAEKQAAVDALPGRVSYRQLDLGNADEVARLVAGIRQEHGRLDGILHSAGMIADSLIVRKSAARFAEVLAPKVAGVLHLDQATRDVPLDFFALFSSVAGALGNPGQADYATANAFMDRFAAWRNRQVLARQRHGRTRSINWPLWQAGGMNVDAAARELLQQTAGMQPMETATGLRAFHRILLLPYDQMVVMEGDLPRMRRVLLGESAPEPEPQPEPQPRPVIAGIDSDSLVAKTQTWLRNQLAEVMKLAPQKVDPHAPLEEYGIDSILAMKLTSRLEQTFGALSKTLFYEYQTIAALAGFFAKEHPAVMRGLLGLAQAQEAPRVEPAPAAPRVPVRRKKNRFAAAAKAEDPARHDIAIIGLAGRYPQAEDLDQFWRNLQAGRDCITEIPEERWDHGRWFDPDPGKGGKSYSKWGGFLSDVDKFDPLFFNISPKEAALIDPQERLFLETAWQTIEDAGYTKAQLAGRGVGVYVGVMWGQYELFGAESLLGGGTAVPSSSHASIANRVSYFFDFHGPSIAIDTMCSSSLTAIHLACEELRKGELDAAIAGGVNLSLHPYKYLSLSQGRFAASDGRCRAFGAGGDGYVPGEGVGAVLLKRLDKAVRDGDRIYAVIRSSAVNHGGKTNGYTVPNPNAQGELILDALQKAKLDPATLSYVETHGTGTSLGDPIEITGLVKAFGDGGGRKQSVPIGSVKSNIGHLESAAGIAALTKALLQLRHNQLVPSIHADPPNPNIDFAGTPFYVQTGLAEWKRPAAHPRRIGVSSFGAGGSNAHLILEEYDGAREAASVPGTLPFVLSARDAEALQRYAERFVRWLDGSPDVSFADLAYTSQVGRTPMDARLVVVASGLEDLRDKLHRWTGDRAESEHVFHGHARKADFSAGALIAGAAGKAFVDSLLAGGELEKLARLWVLGVDVDWSLLYRGATPRKVSMPTYPFARERYWIEQPALPAPPRLIAAPEPRTRTYWVPEWIAQPLGASSPRRGTTLLLDAPEEWASGGSVVRVQFGDAFAEAAPNVFTVDARREEHFAELVALLAGRGLLPEVVLHRDAQQLDRNLDPLFFLCRALMQRQAAAKIATVASSPLGIALAGFLKTLVLENPRFRAKVIESASAAQVRDEVAESDWSAQEVRYAADGSRQVRRLVQRPELANASAPLPLRQHGVYLITGGLGQLGLLFAEYLAKQHQAKLVLVGRSAPKREAEETLRRLQEHGAEVLCLRADVAKPRDVARVVREAKQRFSRLDGVIHAAGVTRDAFLLRKTKEDLDAVVAAKVQGALNLDRATGSEPLELFVLFSSVAGALGNPGQCDYAYANRFLDAFAESRARTRPGRTLSISWPLWAEGGMTLSADQIALLEKQTGTAPLPADDGLRYWEDFLRSDAVQGVALYGTPSRIAAQLAPKAATTAVPRQAPARRVDDAALVAGTETYLKELIGAEIQLSPDRIGSTDRLESFGIDSVMINRINATLEKDLGALPKTLLYEHETVRELAAYLVRETREALASRLGVAGEPAAVEVVREDELPAPRPHAAEQDDAVAIIGLHGYYPRSASLDEYWEHLRQGRDLVGLVPRERWDAEALFDPDPAAAHDGRIYCKWGAFLDDYDKFDPRFFNIPTEEAKIIDPQERLFLQSVWSAIEDAGYTRESLRRRHGKARSADVGVFVGVTTNTYHLLASHEGPNAVHPSALPWSIANRVSYFFDFNGPSLPVDTACSSSLVAIHLAAESLRRGECQVAVAGGVNLYLHPAKYQSLCRRRMLSTGGTTPSYGAGDDGFVPGEAVGTVVLKPLRRAVADGDRIYAVIRGSAYDHSGRSNGYSAPNPNAQASLIRRTLERAGVQPESIGYVEGHGTGTQLGDSLEIAALTQAFETRRRQFCAIGSVKANLGHSESAAGVAGLAKVLLQLQHRQLAPSIHAETVNPNIEFEETPFYLQRALTEWEALPEQPRRALINSFGAGGVNACLLLEEYIDEYVEERTRTAPAAGPFVFTLSAKNEDRLREYADRLLVHLRGARELDPASLCYTLQTGREAMEERLALVVSTVDELIERLGEWRARGTASGLHRGSVTKRAKRTAASVEDRTPGELAAAWVAGEDVDWTRLYPSGAPRRVALPTYPFARERYWIADGPAPETRAAAEARLHPLVSYNSSTLKEVRFSSSLSDRAFYAVDHRVNDERIFPGAGFLEMACVSGNIAGEQRVHKIKDVVWSHPLRFGNGEAALRTLLRHNGDLAEYVIASLDEEGEEVPHSEGRLVFRNDRADAEPAGERVPLESLKAQSVRTEDGAAFYAKFGKLGLHYGPAFRTVQELHAGGSFALARLKVAEHLEGEFEQFILHPSLIDGALQTAAGLVGGLDDLATPYLPFALDEIELVQPMTRSCWALAELADSSGQQQKYAGVRKFNIRLLSESGEVLVRLQNLFVRALPKSETTRPSAAGRQPAERRVITG